LRPSDADIQTLFALRMHQDLGELDGSLERLQALGCIAWEDDEYPTLTAPRARRAAPLAELTPTARWPARTLGGIRIVWKTGHDRRRWPSYQREPDFVARAGAP